jgi:hypothetical protein
LGFGSLFSVDIFGASSAFQQRNGGEIIVSEGLQIFLIWQ